MLAVVLALLVGLAPYWLSTAVGRWLVLWAANAQLRGRAELDDLSLSWTGPLRLSGIRLYDPQGQAVVDIREITVEMGLLGAVTSPQRFRELVVDSPQIVLKPGEHEAFTLVEALPEPRPRDKREKAPANPNGRVRLKNAMVRMVKLDGSELTVRNINGEVNIQSLGKLAGKIEATLDSGGRVAMDFDVQGLWADGEFQPASATAKMNLRTPEPVNLQPVMKFATGKDYPAGEINVDGHVDYAPDGGSLKLALTARGLSAGEASRARVRPMDASVQADLSLQGQRVSGTVAFAGEAGNIDANFEFPREAEAWKQIRAEDLLAAVLEGRRLSLPEFSLKVDGRVDAARLGEAIPELLQLRRDVRIAAGVAEMKDVHVTGGTQPQARGSARLSNFKARLGEGDQQRSVAWKPIDLSWDVSLREEVGLEVREIALSADFATLQAEGSPRKGSVTFAADGGKMYQQFAEVFDCSGMEWTGTLSGRLDADRADDRPEEFNARLRATGRDLKITKDGVTRGLKELTLDLPMSIELREGVFGGATLEDGSVVLNRTVPMRVGMSYDAASEGLTSQLASRGDIPLAAVRELARSLGAGFERPIDGKANWVVALSAEGTGKAAFRAEVNVVGLGVDGKPVLPAGQKLALRVEGASVDRAKRSLTVQTLRLDAGRVAKVTAEDVEVSQPEGAGARASGQYTIQADIARAVRAAHPFAEWQEPPALSGMLSARGEVRTEGGVILAQQQGQVDDLVAGKGSRAVRYGKVKWDAQACIDPQAERLELTKFEMTSDFLKLVVQPGSEVKQFRTERLLDVRGSFEGRWNGIMPLLYELAPELKTEAGLALAGPVAPTEEGQPQKRGEFVITGTAHQPTVQPVFRGVKGRTALGWSSGALVGLELGAADIRLTMQQGRLTIAAEPIPASEGALKPGGYVDFTGKQPVYHLPGRTRFIDKVKVNPEVGDKLLSRINPIFGKLAGLEGDLTLELTDLSLPLGEALKTSGSGRGRLDLSNLRMSTKKGPLAKLLEWRGIKGGLFEKVGFSGLDFAIREGKVTYRNFKLSFGEEFDMIFRGSVGFDDSVEMWVSLPVYPGLLKRFEVTGVVAEYARVLQDAGVRIEIPLKGTRMRPELDLSRVDVKPLVKKAVELLLKEKARKGLERLLEGVLKP